MNDMVGCNFIFPLLRISIRERKIARLLDEMMDYFEAVETYNMGGTYSVRSVTVPDKNGGRSHEKYYYIEKRLFTEEELRLLCDSVCFSPGLSINDAKHMIEKLTRLASKSFNNIFRFVFYSDIILRTYNEKVFENLRIISEAISRNCKVAVYYKERETSTVISPFFLVAQKLMDNCHMSKEEAEAFVERNW